MKAGAHCCLMGVDRVHCREAAASERVDSILQGYNLEKCNVDSRSGSVWWGVVFKSCNFSVTELFCKLCIVCITARRDLRHHFPRDPFCSSVDNGVKGTSEIKIR
jgi:hypothetical protein